MKEKFKKIPIIREVVNALEHLKLPGASGFSIYSLTEMYLLGIIRGAFSARAGSISFSFFMAFKTEPPVPSGTSSVIVLKVTPENFEL